VGIGGCAPHLTRSHAAEPEQEVSHGQVRVCDARYGSACLSPAALAFMWRRCAGKVFKIGEDRSSTPAKLEVHASFGGLLMLLKVCAACATAGPLALRLCARSG
jgi:hypothetical protein